MLNDCLVQLQRIPLKGQKYGLHVGYIPGKSIHAADPLSWAAMTEKMKKTNANRARIIITGVSGDKVFTNHRKKLKEIEKT